MILISDDDLAYHLGKVESPFVLELLKQLRDTRTALLGTAIRMHDGNPCWCEYALPPGHEEGCLAARAMTPKAGG